MNIREDEIDLVPYLNACSIGEFKITPTVSLFENEEVVLLHVCARQGQTKVNFDLWPYYKLTFKDILDLPMPIVNVRFVIPYILMDTSSIELTPKWLSFTTYDGIERSFSGERIVYDEEKEYQVRLMSLPKVFSPDIRYLFLDTETTGLPHKVTLDLTGRTEWPRLVQLSWIITNGVGSILSKSDFIIRPDGFQIPASSEAIHGISTSRAIQEGRSLAEV